MGIEEHHDEDEGSSQWALVPIVIKSAPKATNYRIRLRTHAFRKRPTKGAYGTNSMFEMMTLVMYVGGVGLDVQGHANCH